MSNSSTNLFSLFYFPNNFFLLSTCINSSETFSAIFFFLFSLQFHLVFVTISAGITKDQICAAVVQFSRKLCGFTWRLYDDLDPFVSALILTKDSRLPWPFLPSILRILYWFSSYSILRTIHTVCLPMVCLRLCLRLRLRVHTVVWFETCVAALHVPKHLALLRMLFALSANCVWCIPLSTPLLVPIFFIQGCVGNVVANSGSASETTAITNQRDQIVAQYQCDPGKDYLPLPNIYPLFVWLSWRIPTESNICLHVWIGAALAEIGPNYLNTYITLSRFASHTL